MLTLAPSDDSSTIVGRLMTFTVRNSQALHVYGEHHKACRTDTALRQHLYM